MSTLSEQIREASRLARMRLGQDVAEPVDIPSLNGVRVALVPLTEAETQQGIIRAAELQVADNSAGLAARNRAALHHDLWSACRNPSAIEEKAFDSPEEMVMMLHPNDIDWLSDNLSTLMDYASPAIDGFTDEALDELKKAFARIDLSGLTGRQWAVVKLCFLTILPDLLRAKLLGSTSTDSLITTSESGESISAASPS